jgi:hypothetical protein
MVADADRRNPLRDVAASPHGFYRRRGLMKHSKHGMVRIMSPASMFVGLMLVGVTAGWAQQKPLKAQLIGAWDLVSIEVIAKDGSKRPGFGGPKAKGILILDASGRYAQVTGNPERPKLSTTVRKDIPAAELGEAARTFGARYGAWSVDEADRTLTLTNVLPMIADPAEAARKAAATVSGKELKLVESQTGSRTEFVFQRAR